MSKPVVWIGSARRAVGAFPPDARRQAGREIWEIQEGRDASDSKSMVSVGEGAKEIRIHTQLEHRVIYVAKFEEAIYVLHAFEKKSRRTALRDLAIARSRYREVSRDRRS